ncbi:MAG: hypothetical protein NXH88_09905 [Hyphomonas sp.]|nr:hypothetical protein [Hyphomonas sp.]
MWAFLVEKVFLQAAVGLLVAYLYGSSQFNTGYDEGFDQGRIDAVSDFSDETIDLVLERNLKIDQAIDTRKANAESDIADEKAAHQSQIQEERIAFESELDGREAQFVASLDTLIDERYSSELENADRTDYDRGYSDGKVYGEDEATRISQAACESAMADFRSYGRLWNAFSDAIWSYVEEKPVTETAMRSRAEAIVEIASEGRRSALGLAAQLNSQVDQIAAALRVRLGS